MKRLVFGSDDGAHPGAGAAPHSGCSLPRLLPEVSTSGERYVLSNAESLLHRVLSVFLPANGHPSFSFTLGQYGIDCVGAWFLMALWIGRRSLYDANNYQVSKFCPRKAHERGVGDVLPPYSRDGLLLACWRVVK